MWQFIHEKDPSLYWRDIRWELAIWKNLNVEHRITIVEGSANHISWSNPKEAEEFRRWLQNQKLKNVTYPSYPSEVAKE